MKKFISRRSLASFSIPRATSISCNNLNRGGGFNRLISRNLLETSTRKSFHISNMQQSNNNQSEHGDAMKFTNGLITKTQLKQLINSHQSYCLIDVRSQPETVGYHPILPTAFNIPIYDLEMGFDLDDEDFKANFKFNKPLENDLIIVYCEHGVRSAMAQQILTEEFGYTNVVNYYGSAHDWYL